MRLSSFVSLVGLLRLLFHLFMYGSIAHFMEAFMFNELHSLVYYNFICEECHSTIQICVDKDSSPFNFDLDKYTGLVPPCSTSQCPSSFF